MRARSFGFRLRAQGGLSLKLQDFEVEDIRFSGFRALGFRLRALGLEGSASSGFGLHGGLR